MFAVYAYNSKYMFEYLYTHKWCNVNLQDTYRQHYPYALLMMHYYSLLLFTALHAMQTRSSDENSVCLSVRLSVTRVHCDKTVERSVEIYIP